jgi:hypothetical protein
LPVSGDGGTTTILGRIMFQSCRVGIVLVPRSQLYTTGARDADAVRPIRQRGHGTPEVCAKG